MRVEFDFASENPIDRDGVAEYTGDANRGDDQHRAEGLLAAAGIVQGHVVGWVDRREHEIGEDRDTE